MKILIMFISAVFTSYGFSADFEETYSNYLDELLSDSPLNSAQSRSVSDARQRDPNLPQPVLPGENDVSSDDLPMSPPQPRSTALEESRFQRLPRSKDPVFHAFVYCAVNTSGAKVEDADTGKITVLNDDDFLFCVRRACSKPKQTKDRRARVVAIKRFTDGWPHEFTPISDSFPLTIKKTKLSLFKSLYRQYSHDKEPDLVAASLLPQKRQRPSDDES